MSASRTALSDAVGLRVEEQVAQMVPGATGCGIFGCIYKDIYICLGCFVFCGGFIECLEFLDYRFLETGPVLRA